ncbi:cytochrome c oxidase subunit VA-domain-containing protein [Glomus cerebriforme]|uniref:Cytochrome c oxidase subunit 6, mitochondrial n=1 Tax=Glomus cerebriforme TaxID=658196 RepID=A0A397SNJ5_9GLOM|nr:cytochrome c oxidase subunit VA-domain-containing protein [Glomus cerebriforme]
MYRLNAITRTIPRTILGNNRIAMRAAKVSQPLTYKGGRFYSGAHEDESFEEITERYVKFFEGVDDRFELSRGLNNCFAYDLVPAPSVIEASLKAARRVNDFPTAVRIFEGLKQKVENEGQYNQYLEELKPIKEELGILTKEELGF